MAPEIITALGTAAAAVITALTAAIGAAFAKIAGVRKQLVDDLARCESGRAELDRRMTAFEASQGNDFPKWLRDEAGTIITITPEFLRIIGAPLGLRRGDFVGKQLSDIPGLSPNLAAILQLLDVQALSNKFVAKSGVEFIPGRRFTVMKRCEATQNGMLYIGIVIPDLM